jgi:hypothetical protein
MYPGTEDTPTVGEGRGVSVKAGVAVGGTGVRVGGTAVRVWAEMAWTVRATMVGTRAAEVGTTVGGWRTSQAPVEATKIRQSIVYKRIFFMVFSFKVSKRTKVRKKFEE